MQVYTHTPGVRYRVMDGVRRVKAAQMHGHAGIRAEVQTHAGASLGECELAIDDLISSKMAIRRMSEADEIRWARADGGAAQAILPFPPIIVIPTKKTGPTFQEVDFEYGGTP